MDTQTGSIGAEQALAGAHDERVAPGADSAGVRSLYVHLPWCAKKCPYCDFNSHESRGDVPQSDYVAALLSDLRFESAAHGCGPFETIYIGGGTPSLFSERQIARLLEGVDAAVNITPDAEITLEANPGAIEAGRFRGFRAAGVNRVSVGVQSLRDAQLVRLGRIHDAAQACAAIGTALAAGFASVNLDLMYGLPGDDPDDGLYDLGRALALGTPHLSWYQLTLEPNTAWERRPPPAMPAEETVDAIESAGRELLAAHGFARYEVSAWARPGHQCRHNVNYWRFGDYVGIGAGAHSKRRSADRSGHLRYGKRRNPLSYLRDAGTPDCVESTESVLEPRAVALEYLMNALRLRDGVAAAEFTMMTGLDDAVIAAALTQARREGLLAGTTARLCLTEQGMSQLNRVLRLVC